MNIGVVGAGGIGAYHVRAVKRSNRAHLIAVCDADTDLLKKIGNQTAAATYTDYKRMIDSEKLDALILALPNQIYPEIIKAAANFHILKEKPLARTYKESQELLAVVERSGKLFAIGTQRRFAQSFGRAKEHLPRIGRINLVRASFMFCFDEKLKWRASREKSGGGCVLDLGYHVFDLLNWYFGPPSTVAACQNMLGPQTKYDTEDNAVILLKYADGIIGEVALSRGFNPIDDRVMIFGDCGSIELFWGNIIIRNRAGEIEEKIECDDDMEHIFLRQLENFIGAIQGNNPLLSSAAEGVPVMQVIEAAYNSMLTDQFVNII